MIGMRTIKSGNFDLILTGATQITGTGHGGQFGSSTNEFGVTQISATGLLTVGFGYNIVDADGTAKQIWSAEP